MKIEVQTNGFEAKALQRVKAVFDRAAEKLFPDCTVSHFYYGENFDMADVLLGDGMYAHFTISENTVHLTGYTCSREDELKFERMTWRDWLYKNGELYNI